MTSRILVVDLLKKVCPVEKVSGILVYNAHKLVQEIHHGNGMYNFPANFPALFSFSRLTDTSSESFIVRLYREGNQVSPYE